MSDGAIVMLGFFTLTFALAMSGLLYDRLKHSGPKPLHWSDSEHQHALIMSRYYANFGPPE
jgi:hypothetical protein